MVVDAAQGIEAQTIANLYLALEQDLTIIPVINKIDLPNANIPKVTEELKRVFGFQESDIVLCSGKTGEGVPKLIEEVIKRIKPPKDSGDDKVRSLIFDSKYDAYRGVIALVKVVDGSLRVGDHIK